MNFYTVRDLRTTPKSIWENLSADGEVIITNNRRPTSILFDIADGRFEETVKAVRQAKAIKYLSEFDQMFSGDYPDTPEARKYVQFNRQRHDRQILLNILRLGTEDGSIRGDIDANMLELTIGNTLLGVAQRILPREKNYAGNPANAGGNRRSQTGKEPRLPPAVFKGVPGAKP